MKKTLMTSCTPSGLVRRKSYNFLRKTLPGWTALAKFSQMLKDADGKARATGRAIVFCHYAGHGFQGVDNELHLSSESGLKTFAMERLISVATEHESSPVDVLFVLDCCASFLATKGVTITSRIVEVIAAVDADKPRALVPGQAVSFSAKLATEVAYLKGQGVSSIEVAELISALRVESPARKPTHMVRLGTTSVRLQFPGSMISRSMGAPKLRAVFQIHVNDDFTLDELKGVAQWIHSLSPRVKLNLEGVFETGSTCFIFQSSFALFSRLNGIPGVSLICECTGANRLDEMNTVTTTMGLTPRTAGSERP